MTTAATRIGAFMVVMLAVSATHPAAQAQPFTTSQVAAVAASQTNCLDWRVAGICFWVVCSPAGCWIETSSRFAHNLPDLIITGYNRTGASPYVEGRAAFSDAATTTAGALLRTLGAGLFGGGGFTSETSTGNGNVRFKEVDVVGSPTSLITDAIAGATGFMCQSESMPMYPYFLSAFDALAWRTHLPDGLRPEAVIPGLREIGYWPTNTWGKVFPRGGFLVQSDDAKCAAVMAQRAVDIVLQPGQPHVYTALGYDGYAAMKRSVNGIGVTEVLQWMPAANELRPAWQSVSPLPSSVCERFGAPGPWSTGRISPSGEYGYLYWRCYECCYPNAGTYIGSVEWAGCELPL